MERLTREKSQEVMASLNESLRQIEKMHGIKLVLEKATWASSHATFKIMMTPVIAGLSAQKTKQLLDGEKILPTMGLEIGMPFRFGGNMYKISGLARSNKKYPIIAESEDGRSFKFALSSVRAGLNWER
jgi:hypothetical protein